MAAANLPLLDEHATDVAARPDDVWAALGDALEGFSSRPAGLYARLVGCADTRATGPRPLAAGSTIPGFHVATAEPQRQLVLEGRHRFSAYALTFTLEPTAGGGTRVTAESRAAFPGLPGRLYRTALLRTGGHVLGVRRLLDGVRRRAEQRARCAAATT